MKQLLSEFAFSTTMQVILAIVTFATSFINMYLTTKLITAFYLEPFSAKRRALFAMLTGVVMVNVWIYGAYLIGGSQSFPPLTYYAVCTVNPLFALLYYYIGVKIMELPATHSVRLMGHVYLYYILGTAVSRLVSALFFAQSPGPYNYLLDLLKQLASLGVALLMYWAVLGYLRLTGFSISLADKASRNMPAEMALFMLRSTFAYVMAVLVPVAIRESVIANVLLVIVYTLLLFLDMQIDQRKALRARLENKKVHVNALRSSMEEYSAVKHDFFNILQTYQGYISMGDLDQLKRYHATLARYTLKADTGTSLSVRMEAHPELVSLLAEQAEAAERIGVKLYIDVKADLSTLCLAAGDLCAVVACLLNHAIEGAAQSAHRHVFFSIERKGEDERLITVTHSTAHPPEARRRPNQPNAYLAQARRTLAQYANCTFHTAYYDFEFSAYLAIRPPLPASGKEKKTKRSQHVQ